MNKENENIKLMPELRFAEFDKDGEWRLETVDNLSETVTAGGTPSTIKDEYWGGNIRWMNSGELNLKIVREVEGRITDKGLKNSSTKIIPVNCVLIGLAGQGKTRGTVATNKVEICTNQSIASIFPNDEVFDSSYLYHNLDNRYNELRELSAGGQGRGGLNLKIIKELKIPIPPEITEQQKIAATLTSLDHLIAAENEKLEALQAHKKGLLQQLFPAKGEKMPRVRFGEFSGEWEIRSIAKNIDMLSGIALKSKELTNNKSGTPILRGINITEGKIRHSQEMDKFYLGDTSKIDRYIVEENDIVIGMDGSKVGKNVALISKHDAGSILIQRVARIRAVDSDIKYLYQHFVSHGFRSYVDMVNTSSGIPHISAKQIRDYEIGFPPTIKEQQKISYCLSSLDNKIATQSEEIEALSKHKKGLMQQMFP